MICEDFVLIFLCVAFFKLLFYAFYVQQNGMGQFFILFYFILLSFLFWKKTKIITKNTKIYF